MSLAHDTSQDPGPCFAWFMHRFPIRPMICRLQASLRRGSSRSTVEYPPLVVDVSIAASFTWWGWKDERWRRRREEGEDQRPYCLSSFSLVLNESVVCGRGRESPPRQIKG